MIASQNYLLGQDIMGKHRMDTLYIEISCLIFDSLIGKGYKDISYAAYDGIYLTLSVEYVNNLESVQMFSFNGR